MPARDVWRKLESRGGMKAHSTGWLTKCPAHNDTNESLSVRKSDRGSMLLYCQGGCETKDVVAALGFTMSDLFADPMRRKTAPRISATYDYIDEDGVLLYQSVRMEPKDFRVRSPDGNGGWKWGIDDGTRRVLYRLPEMIEEKEAPVFVCEGEKDCDNLRKVGVTAVAIQGGSGAWRECYARQLDGRRAIVLPDNDRPGMKFAMDVYASVPMTIVVRLKTDIKGADVTDWMKSGAGKNELFSACKKEAEINVGFANSNMAYWRDK